MGRTPCCDKNGLKKGPWTPEEDQKLIGYIQMHGPGNWRSLPKNAGLQRCGKSCRLRWTNYLRPDIKRGRFSFEEEETIIQLHRILGNKWSAIAARLPGRTDNEIKNYWNTHIRKRLLRNGIDPVTHAPRLDLLDISSIISSALCNQSLLSLSNLLGTQALLNPELLRLTNTLQTLNEENPELVLQRLQDFQIYNSIKQNQSVSLSSQSNNILNHTEIHQIPSQEISVSTAPNLSCQDNFIPSDLVNPQPNLFYGNSTANLTTIPDIPEMRNFQEMSYNGYNNHNFGVDSVILTPMSSPEIALNSSSTFVNSSTTTTEIDERASYCSSLLKFEIPESLDIEDFM